MSFLVRPLYVISESISDLDPLMFRFFSFTFVCFCLTYYALRRIHKSEMHTARLTNRRPSDFEMMSELFLSISSSDFCLETSATSLSHVYETMIGSSLRQGVRVTVFSTPEILSNCDERLKAKLAKTNQFNLRLDSIWRIIIIIFPSLIR